MIKSEERDIKETFDVAYVCYCGNEGASPAQKPYEIDARVRVIDSNMHVICNSCGKIMVPKVIKTTCLTVITKETLNIGWENANPERVQNEEKEN